MIRLTASLRRSRLAARVPEQFDPAAHGLVPRQDLDDRWPGPPPPLHEAKAAQALADAAWDGDWQAAAAHLEGAGQDWDEHWSRMELLQQIAAEDDGWVDAWRAARPEDGDAATLHALLLLRRAWAIRGSAYAHEVPEERMSRFQQLVPASVDAARKASLAAPGHPGPWVVMVTAARGAQYSPAQFVPLWAGLTARAPHHYEAHWQALQYWCAKWFGSDRQMLAFAEYALSTAPEGSPLAGVYLHALQELEQRGSRLPSGRRARDLLLAVARSLGSVPAGDRRLPRLRHLLAHHLLRTGLYEAALEQFRLIGPWCGASPWDDERDIVAAFDLARGTAALGAARRART
ncbi:MULTISPECIES: hypothetical protein [unclassified Streptomyces]|uniref:hypothetical protein n=1 Tax=unclassified Streptomyces TaxID=2593676 RepID=UPI0008DD9E9C|nr:MULTISPECIES: hypothetical protein [unclassified Streptomyces]OII67893.1 hypothetical protein BJP39_23295 [Streptomyces sp. CC77]